MKRQFLFTICVIVALAASLYGAWPVSAQEAPVSLPLDHQAAFQGSHVRNVTTLANTQTPLSTAVFVSEPYSGSVLKVDGSGTKTVYASGLQAPSALKFDKNGNLFVLAQAGLLKVAPDGSVSTFTTDLPPGIVDLTITDDGKPFVLAFGSQPAPGQLTPYPHEPTSSIWELVEGGAPIFLATTENVAPLGQTARGFTTGPGGDFYLAMQGGNGGGRILRVTRTGQVSTFFDPGLPPFNSGGANMIDVRFNSQGEMLILVQVAPGNTRAIVKVKNGVLSVFVDLGGILDQALQLTIDSADNLFVSGGGFGGCPASQIDCFEGFIQHVDPLGNVTTLATFPPLSGQQSNPIMDIDDDSFDSFIPTDNAGGPYWVNEGSPVTVTATGGDPVNGPWTYAWDLDDDGSFETPGQSATFTAAALDGPSDYTIQVQVTDNGGLTAVYQTIVHVLNVAPTGDFTSTPSTLPQGQSATLSFGNPFDPGVTDSAAGFHYSFDCTNDGTFELENALDASYSCTYPAAGTFTARGRIADKDGGFIDYRVEVITTPTYTTTDLGTLGGSSSRPLAINEAGQVIGYSYLANGDLHAVLWQDDEMTDLGTLGGSYSYPVAINEAGQVIGQSLPANGSYHAFVWQNGVMSDLGTLGGSESSARAINEAGQVIGSSYLANGSYHAVLWQNGEMTDLGTLGGSYSNVLAINEAGQVIGESDLADGSRHAFVWQNGVMTDLGTLGGSDSHPIAINEAGQVIGWSYLADGSYHAFLWQSGVRTDLGTLGGRNSQPVAINEVGQVIGRSDPAGDSIIHGFVWQGGVITDLGTLGGFATHAINNAGQVLYSAPTNNSSHASIWENGVTTDLGTLGGPTSEPVAINEAGQVIGGSTGTNVGYHAFVWEAGVMIDLGTFGGTNSYTVAINEVGQVIGYSARAGDTGEHAFIASLTSGITSTGDNVTVSPGSDTTLTFANVSSEGQTAVRTSSSAPALPAGFSLGEPPTFYDIHTNATYSPPVTVCFTYDPAQYSDPANLHLLHYENDAWVDATTSNDTTDHVICGQVSSLSPFAVAERVTYHFSGFFQPVDNVPTLNVVKGGNAVPVRFSLGGDQGLSIFDTGYPVSQKIACDSAAPVDVIEQTVSVGESGLQYDATTDTYTYVWKTQKNWAGTCRQLILRLNDGTDHLANFQFKK